MKFVIVGAGAIGGYLATRLALAGHDVVCLARGRNLEAIQQGGFRLRDDQGREEHAPTVRAVARGEDAAGADYVLLAVKAHQVADLLPQLRALLAGGATLVTMVNGVPWWYFHRLAGPHEGRRLDSVDPGGAIADAIDPACVVGSVVYPAAELVAPGVVQLVEGNRFTLGEPDGSRSPRVEALAQALMQAGFKAPVSKDIRGEIWVKLWGNLSFNPISALTHMTLAQICRYAPTRALAEAMMTEGQAVAQALGVQFRLTLAQRIAGAEAVGEHKTSMLQDVEAGRALELAALVGAVVELAGVVGVAVPHIAAVHALAQGLQQQLQARHAALRPVPLGQA